MLFMVGRLQAKLPKHREIEAWVVRVEEVSDALAAADDAQVDEVWCIRGTRGGLARETWRRGARGWKQRPGKASTKAS